MGHQGQKSSRIPGLSIRPRHHTAGLWYPVDLASLRVNKDAKEQDSIAVVFFIEMLPANINYYFLLLLYTGQGNAFGHNPDRCPD